MSKIVKYILLLFLFATLNYGIEVKSEIIENQNKLENIPKNKAYFGEQLFQGHFTNKSQFRENPEYILKIGDIIHINVWGAMEFQGDVPIDGKGNIFLPKVGVIHLEGIKNAQLDFTLKENLKKTFNDNVFIYANVRDYQALSVYVSGVVKNVGLYDGLSTDSVLQFLDKAGGVISGVGSYRNIQILRNNNLIKTIDLYSFLIDGYREKFSFRDGDTILVKPIGNYVEIDGDVNRPYIFEFTGQSIMVKDLINYALVQPGVNRFTHIELRGMKEISNDYHIQNAENVIVKNGEKVIFSSNRHLESYNITIKGEHSGFKSVSVPKNTSLYSLLKELDYTPLSNIRSIQIFRTTVAQKQKTLLETNLKELESRTLITSSATSEEATIRSKDAEHILEFIKRARNIKFKGQIILSSNEDLRATFLEDGDEIYIPRKNNIVTIQGEVNIPNTLTYKSGDNIDYYIEACGGYTERADTSNVLLVKSNGRVERFARSGKIEPGDSILVLGKTETKDLILAKDLTQIIYQVAVGAAVVLKSF